MTQHGVKSDKLRSLYGKNRVLIHTISTLLLGVLVWEFFSRRVSDLIMVPLGEIFSWGWADIRSGQFTRDLMATSEGFIIGLLISCAAGILIGLVMAISTIAFNFLDPWVSALYSTPIIALAPLFIIIFGFGTQSRVAVVISLAVLPVIINTTAGIKTTDQDLLETARAFGAGRAQVFRKVLLPWAVPFIITGIRLAVGRALIGVVVAEFFGSTVGLGHSVISAAQAFDTAGLWFNVLVLAALGVVLIRFMSVVERWVAPWRTRLEM